MAGRKTCIMFHNALPICPLILNNAFQPLSFLNASRRFLRSLARNVGKRKPAPAPEITAEEITESETRKTSERKTKLREQFIPFQIKVPDVVNAENQYGCLAQVITPLWEVPYDEQLKLKQKWARHVLTTLRKKLEKDNFRNIFEVNRVLQEIVPSPVTEKYRNKDELCVHQGVDGNPKTVGFFVGSHSKGNIVCIRSKELINMRDSHKKLADVFEQYVTSSPLRACLHFQDGGHWRNLIMRSNLAGDLMAIVVMHPQDMSPENMNKEAESLARFFSEGDGRDCNLTSLYFQACPHTRCTHDQAPFQLLLGKPFLEEVCLGRRFRLSPDSFFQVNTLAAELLYEVVLSMADPSSMTTLLDVCCGTGTFATIASPSVRGVVGIESVYSAVRDARANVVANNCSNVEIIPGLAEKKLQRVIDELDLAAEIVAVVNPGRSGVAPRVIRALRECKQIEKVVYVSCDPSGPAMKNFEQLCVRSEGKGKKWPKDGLPFHLTRAVPVDMFPHTIHCELVLQFYRKL